ncbi:MAG: cytochrome c3 [Gemmatimonadetes bacterium]|nr:cytochrome c3 [Gemmatimonadota bacterium]
MTKRRKWTAIPGLLALAALAVMLSAYSGASSSQGHGPAQPIAFPHPKHAGAVADGGLGLNCVYCHYAANKSPDPGMPAVGTCIGCHALGAVAGTTPGGQAEIKKLQAFAASNKPVPWERIHKVPEYVHFPHVRHVNAGVTCQTCHGQVQKMDRVYQYASLNMGWCVQCHVNGYDPQEGLKAAGYAPATSPATPGTTSANTTPTPSAEKKKARYDCANCHY